MQPQNLLADISRSFFKKHNVYKYRTKKIEDMSDEECITKCHWYCEENNLTDEFNGYRKNIESEYKYCKYYSEYIDDDFCADIQMIAYDYIKKSMIADFEFDREKAIKCCEDCRYKF